MSLSMERNRKRRYLNIINTKKKKTEYTLWKDANKQRLLIFTTHTHTPLTHNIYLSSPPIHIPIHTIFTLFTTHTHTHTPITHNLYLSSPHIHIPIHPHTQTTFTYLHHTYTYPYTPQTHNLYLSSPHIHKPIHPSHTE